ncbi:MAG TPA: DUF488 domain-containing protein [Actinomycetota bacterium]
MTTVWTVGHSTHPIETFLELLRGAGIRRLVDVRTAPGSRRHPQFGREALAASLEQAGVGYEWRGEELGGWRKARPDSRHTALRSAGFRGYADHMESESFREALDGLLDEAEERPTAVMCAEALWWRCHRSMIADAVAARGHEARHLMPDGSIAPHRPRFSRVEGGVPVYDP